MNKTYLIILGLIIGIFGVYSYKTKIANKVGKTDSWSLDDLGWKKMTRENQTPIIESPKVENNPVEEPRISPPEQSPVQPQPPQSPNAPTRKKLFPNCPFCR